jgi:hypothetical protein
MVIYRTDKDNTSTSLNIVQNGARLKLQKGSSSPLFTSSDFLQTGQWHYLVFSYSTSDNEFILYVDGATNRTASVSGSYSYTGGNGAFVDDASTQNSYIVDEVGAWARYSLAQTDIDLLFSSGKGNNDFIYQLWSYYPAQQDVNLKGHNLEHVREPRKSHHASTKAYTDAGDYILQNAHLYYDFETTEDKFNNRDFSTSGASLKSSGGLIQYAAEFNGGSDHLDLEDGLHSLTAYDFSVSFFVKLADRSTDQILVHSNDSNKSGTVKAFFQLQFLSSNNQLQFSSDGMNLNDGTISTHTDVTSTNDVITDGNYHHIVVRRRGQGRPNEPDSNSPESSQPVEIFVDGLKVARETIPLRSLTTTDPDVAEFGHASGLDSSEKAPPSTISHSNSPIQSGGLVSEFGVWNRWLNDREILYLYHDGNGINKFLELMWSFSPARSTVNVNNHQVKNVGTPTDEKDAVRLTDLTKWRSGNLNVRQTVGTSLLNKDQRPAMLGPSQDPKSVATHHFQTRYSGDSIAERLPPELQPIVFLPLDTDVSNLVDTDHFQFSGTPQFTTNGKGVRNEALYKTNDSEYLYLSGVGSGRHWLTGTGGFRLFSMWFHLNDVNRTANLIYQAQNGENAFEMEQKGRNIALRMPEHLYSPYDRLETTNNPIPQQGGWVHIGMYKTPIDFKPEYFNTIYMYVNGQRVPSFIQLDTDAPSDNEVRFMEGLPASSDERMDLYVNYGGRGDITTGSEQENLDAADIFMGVMYHGGYGLAAEHVLENEGAPWYYPLQDPDDYLLPNQPPPQFTFGDGFEEGTQLNIGVTLNNPPVLAWKPPSVTPNETYYMYVEYDESTDSLSTGTTSLPPVYSFQSPYNPTSGQYWYPIDHRRRGMVYDGSNWQPILRVFVGEATADENGDFTRGNIHTYAYQGRYVSPFVQAASEDSYLTFTHNIGTKLVNPMFVAQYTSGNEEYEAGDEIILRGSHNASYATYNRKNGRESMIAYQKEGVGNFTKAKGNAVSQNAKWDDLKVGLYAQRLF